MPYCTAYRRPYPLHRRNSWPTVAERQAMHDSSLPPLDGPGLVIGQGDNVRHTLAVEPQPRMSARSGVVWLLVAAALLVAAMWLGGVFAGGF